MKQAGKIVLMALSLALLQGCAFRKAKTKPPIAAQAPTTTDQAGVMYPSPFPQTTDAPPTTPEPTKPKVAPPPPPSPKHQASTRKKTSGVRAKSKPSAAKPMVPNSAEPASAPVQQAAVEPSGVSPIGQLSSGEGANGAQKRHDTSDLISNTEQGLNAIKRALNTQEQETATQIRTYLKQAKQALTVDDVDGASTLATKAKVLLEELTKS
ncbi:MAG TPA: hypothetical protein VM554_03025 [Acidisarcina sp.]|nr:hypothetical protein [Acidisarcina sp.]